MKVALALTWDGARWPVRSLPAPARAFLGAAAAAPSARTLAGLFKEDRVTEIRVCWVPRLKGGEPVLSAPFSAPGGLRVAFTEVKKVPLGDCLGIVYRRQKRAIK